MAVCALTSGSTTADQEHRAVSEQEPGVASERLGQRLLTVDEKPVFSVSVPVRKCL